MEVNSGNPTLDELIRRKELIEQLKGSIKYWQGQCRNQIDRRDSDVAASRRNAIEECIEMARKYCDARSRIVAALNRKLEQETVPSRSATTTSGK